MTTRPGVASQLPTPSVESIVSLTRELVAIPSRGGEDSCEPMIEHVSAWLHDHGVAVSVLTADIGRPVAVVGEVVGAEPGPTYCLDACLDTAPFGDLSAWHHPPTEPHIEDGWLHGRGAADCKVAVAIFSHLAADFQQIRDNLRGRLLVLFDADEHTGDFAGVKTFLRSYPRVDGVLIGYPGNQVSSSAHAASTARPSPSTASVATLEDVTPARRARSSRRHGSCKRSMQRRYRSRPPKHSRCPRR